ncbi:MAG: glycosyltransferase [Candidatus Hodarchaeota archaeon]
MMIVAYNDAVRLERCLKSIKKQDYPNGLIDIVLVDDGSTDDTVRVAKKYGARVFVNPRGYIYRNWMIGLKKIKGEFFFTPETDIVLAGPKFIKRMIRPMLDDKRIIASFTDEKLSADMHWAARFLS